MERSRNNENRTKPNAVDERFTHVEDKFHWYSCAVFSVFVCAHHLYDFLVLQWLVFSLIIVIIV